MTPKLTYFNIKGLAEPIRLLLKYGDIEFEDVRIEKDKWPEIKPSKLLSKWSCLSHESVYLVQT